MIGHRLPRKLHLWHTAAERDEQFFGDLCREHGLDAFSIGHAAFFLIGCFDVSIVHVQTDKDRQGPISAALRLFFVSRDREKDCSAVSSPSQRERERGCTLQ